MPYLDILLLSAPAITTPAPWQTLEHWEHREHLVSTQSTVSTVKF